jgi:hypothetical protein
MPITLCAAKRIASDCHHGGRLDRNNVQSGRSGDKANDWNTWIVIYSLIVVVAAVLFIEHHIRGLMVHSGVLR